MFTSTINWADVIQMVILPVGLPSLVGLVTKASWPTLAKRLTLGGLTLVTTVITSIGDYLVTGTPVPLDDLFIQWLITWGFGELVYYGILKAQIKKPVVVEQAVPVPPINVEDHSKPALLSIAESLTGTLPASSLKKEQIGEIINDATPQRIDVTVQPAVTIAGWLANHGVKDKAQADLAA